MYGQYRNINDKEENINKNKKFLELNNTTKTTKNSVQDFNNKITQAKERTSALYCYQSLP